MLRGSLSGADGLVIATDPTAGSTVQMDYTMAWTSRMGARKQPRPGVCSRGQGEVLNCLDSLGPMRLARSSLVS